MGAGGFGVDAFIEARRAELQAQQEAEEKQRRAAEEEAKVKQEEKGKKKTKEDENEEEAEEEGTQNMVAKDKSEGKREAETGTEASGVQHQSFTPEHKEKVSQTTGAACVSLRRLSCVLKPEVHASSDCGG